MEKMEQIAKVLKRQAYELIEAATLIESAYRGTGRIGRPPGSVNLHPRPKMSRAARQKIALAQKKRWAKWKVMNGGKRAA